MSKALTVAYSAVSYVIFLATFLYAIAFVGNLGMPKSLDVGTEADMMRAVIVNLVFLSLFAIQHSGMARPGFKVWWTRIVPAPIERSTFVLATCVVLVLLYWQWIPMLGVVWNVENAAGAMVLQGLFAVGWLIVLLSTFMIGHFDLFGLKQAFFHAVGKVHPKSEFRQPMLYRYVRHPIMLGFFIAFWATPHMTVGHLLFSAVTTAYVLLSVKFLEERDLISHFGSAYLKYKKEVSMFIPWPRRG